MVQDLRTNTDLYEISTTRGRNDRDNYTGVVTYLTEVGRTLGLFLEEFIIRTSRKEWNSTRNSTPKKKGKKKKKNRVLTWVLVQNSPFSLWMVKN